MNRVAPKGTDSKISTTFLTSYFFKLDCIFLWNKTEGSYCSTLKSVRWNTLHFTCPVVVLISVITPESLSLFVISSKKTHLYLAVVLRAVALTFISSKIGSVKLLTLI